MEGYSHGLSDRTRVKRGFVLGCVLKALKVIGVGGEEVGNGSQSEGWRRMKRVRVFLWLVRGMSLSEGAARVVPAPEEIAVLSLTRARWLGKGRKMEADINKGRKCLWARRMELDSMHC